MNRFYFFWFSLIVLTSCISQPEFDSELVNKAAENGKQANEGFARSLVFVEGWMTKTDSITGLIPTNLTRNTDVWEPHNSAADNYAFMVLTAYLTDKDLYNGKMLEMLNSEKKLTSRVKSLPDIWSFPKQNFLSDELKMSQVIFGTSEYIKDGLIPINEYIGKSPWQERMMEMLDDLQEHLVNPADLEILYIERMASVWANAIYHKSNICESVTTVAKLLAAGTATATLHALPLCTASGKCRALQYNPGAAM